MATNHIATKNFCFSIDGEERYNSVLPDDKTYCLTRDGIMKNIDYLWVDGGKESEQCVEEDDINEAVIAASGVYIAYIDSFGVNRIISYSIFDPSLGEPQWVLASDGEHEILIGPVQVSLPWCATSEASTDTGTQKNSTNWDGKADTYTDYGVLAESIKTTDNAIGYCYNYSNASLEGPGRWFLPSPRDLSNVLVRYTSSISDAMDLIGGTAIAFSFSDGCYFSSSQASASTVYAYYGSAMSYDDVFSKTSTHEVRPCAEFPHGQVSGLVCSPSSVTLDTRGTDQTVAVSGLSGTFTVQTSESWLGAYREDYDLIVSASSNGGNGEVTSIRRGVVTITDTAGNSGTVNVTQNYGYIRATRTSVSIDADGGTVALSTFGLTINTNGSGGTSGPTISVSGASWCTYSSSSQTFTIAANTTYSYRTATITASGMADNATVSMTLTITQEGLPTATLELYNQTGKTLRMYVSQQKSGAWSRLVTQDVTSANTLKLTTADDGLERGTLTRLELLINPTEAGFGDQGTVTMSLTSGSITVSSGSLDTSTTVMTVATDVLEFTIDSAATAQISIK